MTRLATVLLTALIIGIIGVLWLNYTPLPGSMARTPFGATEIIETPSAKIVMHKAGEGPEVVMFASAGREASDFNELAEELVRQGFAVTLFEAPGINGAKASIAEPTLYDLAADVHTYLELNPEPVFVVGHAFGNRLARAVAHKYPNKVRGIVLIAAGGLRPIPEAARDALAECFDFRVPHLQRIASVRYAFFADGNPVPDYWMRGWYARTAQLQGAATAAVDSAEWWSGGGQPMLVISGLQDTIAPPEDTIDLLEADYPDQVTAVRIEQAGHAMLPEAPAQIAVEVSNWLASQ